MPVQCECHDPRDGLPIAGTPFPGPDVCPGFIHGHDFLDGACVYCPAYASGQRDRFDHWDWCPFWQGDQCNDCCELAPDDMAWLTFVTSWKRLGDAATGKIEGLRAIYSSSSSSSTSSNTGDAVHRQQIGSPGLPSSGGSS